MTFAHLRQAGNMCLERPEIGLRLAAQAHQREHHDAVAERAGLTVLHVDKDFDLIAAITGQPVERLRLPEDS